MAKLYGEIAKSALLTLDKSFSRALGQPLDASEVYYSLEAAQTYAATPAAYVGQKIVVIEDNKVTHYSVEDAAGTLKEVGVRPVGDGKSITVSAEGVVSILGVASADSLTLPRMKEDKSGIEWVPVSQVVQGDGNDNTTYEFTELVKGEGDAAETYGFSIKTLFNGTEVEGGAIEIAFDVYTKSEADDKFLAKADYTPYDDTALANRVKAVEDNKADKAETLAGYGITDAYTKTEVETAISDAVSGILGEDVKEAYDTLKEIQDILEGTDGETIDGLIETVADNKAKIEILNGGTDVAGSVDKKIADAVAPLATTEALNDVKATAEAAQTAGQVATAIETALADYSTTEEVGTAIETALEDYYTAEEVDNKGYAVASDVERDYAKKATTLAGYGITDAYTKNEIDAKIGTPGTPAIKDSEGNVTTEAVAGTGVFASTYSKAELNALLDEIEGGSTESAASVARQLDEYKTANNQRVADIEVAVGKDVNGEEPATGLFLEVDQARAQADRGVEDAAKASQAVTQLAEGKVAANESNIKNLQALVGAIGDGKTDTLAGMIGALQAHDQAHAVEFGTLSGKVDQNTADIAKKANATDVYTKGETDALLVPYALAANVYTKDAADQLFGTKANAADVYTKTEVNTELAKKLEADALTPYAKSTDVANTYATIAALEAIYKAGEGETAATGILAEEIARATAAEKKIADDLALLIENPTEALDSVKELIEHVTEHGTAVEGIITRLDGHDTAIAGLDERLGAIEAKPDYVLPAATLETLGGVKLSAEIGTNDAGQMEIKSVSTDKLVQGAEELVLFGGKADGAASV
jgi:hypothetical protein